MMPTLLAIEALEADRQYVERQLAEVAASPWGTSRLMWQSRLAEIDEQMRALGASRSNYATVAIIFDGGPVVGSGDIRLDFTTSALDNYQKIISLEFASGLTAEEFSQRGPLPGAEKSHLFIRDIVRGSMGFILEEVAHDQHEMLPTPLKNAVEGSTHLLATLTNGTDDEFEATLEKSQPRLITAVQKFTKILYEAGASTKILGDESRIALSIDDVGNLSRRLSEVQVDEDTIPVNGILLGVLPDSREFELRPPEEGAATIKGSISEELALKYTADTAFKERLLLQPVRAQIKVIRTSRRGRTIRERRVLEALEPIAT